jgi:hypothetical protein
VLRTRERSTYTPSFFSWNFFFCFECKVPCLARCARRV